MTRHNNYLERGATQMPKQVNVASYSLNPQPGLKGVKAFPKDLRATHGFDNQSNGIDSLAALARCISALERLDCRKHRISTNRMLVFGMPSSKSLPQKPTLRSRLNADCAASSCSRFRAPVDDATLARYTTYAVKKIEGGLSFTNSMKKTASAVLSSPKDFSFGHQRPRRATTISSWRRGCRSFFWSSGPDDELLQLAARRELSKPDVLNRTIDRMFADEKIERFLDAFPTQWMQLENAFAATPDPKLNKYFRLDERRPASVHMVLEPLLLFDTAFVENRPIRELIEPTFSYRSEFLTAWYDSDLKPKVDRYEIDRCGEPPE